MKKFTPMILIEVGDAVRVPRFYLPVRRRDDARGWDCYFFLVAPFVLAWIIASETFLIVWKDLVWLANDFKRFRKIK